MEKDFIKMEPEFYGFSYIGLKVTKKINRTIIIETIDYNDTNDENQTYERFLSIYNFGSPLFKYLTEEEKLKVFKTYQQFLYLKYTKWIK